MFNFLSKPSSKDLFARLVDRFNEPVYWFIRRRVGNHDDAADISQEVFIRVFKSINSLRDEKAAKAWIFRIATNEINRFCEQQSTLKTAISEEIEEQVADSENVDYDTAMGQLFQKALQTLSPRQQTVFDLRYYQEMTYEQIAEIMESHPTTMKTTYHIAKEKIKEYILENNI